LAKGSLFGANPQSPQIGILSIPSGTTKRPTGIRPATRFAVLSTGFSAPVGQIQHLRGIGRQKLRSKNVIFFHRNAKSK